MQPGDWIAIIAIASTLLIGIVASTWILGVKIGGINSTLESFKPAIGDVTRIKVSFGQMNVKVEELWRERLSKSKSPIVLNETGRKVLETSKIGDSIMKYYQDILARVKAQSPENPFQAQESLIKIVASYKEIEECKPMLETAAFNSGFDVNSVLYVAALAIRDKIIEDLGFKRDDIDKHDPKNKANPPSQA